MNAVDNNEEKNKIIKQEEEHLLAAEMAYQKKKEHKARASEYNNEKFFTFDLQPFLPTPFVHLILGVRKIETAMLQPCFLQ